MLLHFLKMKGREWDAREMDASVGKKEEEEEKGQRESVMKLISVLDMQ